MSMIVRNNLSALRTYNIMNANHAQMQKDVEKVSTGMKVVTAADDSAPWSISERMRNRIRALEQASSNNQNGSSMIKTAEGAVSNILDTLRTLKEKAINSANDSNTDEDRRTLQKEFNQLVDQIDDDALIQFNGKYLIDGTRNNAFAATRTILVNQSLAEGTSISTALTDLKNRAGDSLNIQSDDYIQASGFFYGETVSRTDVVGSKSLSDILTEFSTRGYLAIGEYSGGNGTFYGDFSIGGQTVHDVPTDKFNSAYHTPNGESGVPIVSGLQGNAGTRAQIAGFTLSITDAQGNIKKSANAALDQFKLYQRAENQTGDLALSFQLGAEANQATKIALTDMRSEALGLKGYNGDILNISTKENANTAINVIDNAIQKVLDQQTAIGAVLTRFERTGLNIQTMATNDQASESTIRDADMAKEMTNYTKSNLLVQSSQSMLAQANQEPMNVMALLNNGESA